MTERRYESMSTRCCDRCGAGYVTQISHGPQHADYVHTETGTELRNVSVRRGGGWHALPDDDERNDENLSQEYDFCKPCRDAFDAMILCFVKDTYALRGKED